MKQASLFLAVGVLLLANGRAQDDEAVKADSIVYDTGTEWQLFASNSGPVAAFTVYGSQLWYATADRVTVLNTRNRQIEEYQKIGDLPAAGVTAMATDCTKVVWFGTKEGAVARKGTSFTTYTDQNGLSNKVVNVIYPTRDGTVWIGTENGVSGYKGGTWRKLGTKDGLAGPVVKAIVADKRGAVWFGTNKGISVFNKGTWSSHNMKSGLSWNDTKALAFDGRENVIWAAVGDQDVNAYDGKKWKVFMTIQEGITSIMADTQSRIWFGSSNPLLKFNGDEWISDPEKLGVPGAMVSQMYRDGSGNLWFACENGVIFLKNPYPF
jgi:ligand-binding sensor domain-containing protein